MAREAIKRNTGARGLRAILEQSMLEMMYDLPNKGNGKKCIITKNVITKGERPVLVLADEADKKPEPPTGASSKDSAESA